MEKTKSFIANGTQRFITAAVLGTIFWTVFFWFSPLVFSCLLGAILCTILFFEWHLLFSAKHLWYWLVMPLYPILPFTILIYCNQTPEYRLLLYYACLTVFTFDSFSYIIGSILGKTKIAPRISPAKTVEGFIGGLLITWLTFHLALLQQETHITLLNSFYITTITCILALLGDLFESFLKRKAGIKDTGILLPGHGGFLDRFDSLLMVSYILFIYKEYLAQILQTF
jgi:phosphatidate cytidylyltransferase